MKRKSAMARGWSAVAVVLTCLSGMARLGAREPASVVSTVHNLSVSGPGEVRSLAETEICKFCHIPHSALEAEPLWGHVLSSVASYEVPDIRAPGGGGTTPAPQPDGSSRLCLSCHDGTVALGEIGGLPRPIQMAGSQRLTPDRPGFLGTDLSGSHPISFVPPEVPPVGEGSERDISVRPLGVLRNDPRVRLDEQSKMQCTTCHDAHADRFFQPDRVPRFWVAPTVSEVCLACHVLH
ncbi:MAG: hypothetical protein KDD47_15415 [Acidobacteria bacterium]|nr:hypothetical protein [Acidobacteriota bacterium]